MKKLLALVLALVMTLGLATVGTNAANWSDLKDTDKVAADREEAFQVLNAIQVIEGDNEGNLNPDKQLTRAEAAAIIARLNLGKTTAESLTGVGSKFTDVPANFWEGKGAGYIEYCASTGIIAGRGDGTFDPNGDLTVAAFAKMLLVSLGYNAETEKFLGPDWQINVMSLANRAGLFAGASNPVATDKVTRADAAQFAFNTLKTPLVTYGWSGSNMVPAGFAVGQTSAIYDTTNARDTQTISRALANDGTARGTYLVEFAERHFPLLVRDSHDTDEWGNPCTTWTYNRAKIDSYKNGTMRVMSETDTVTSADVYKAIGAELLVRMANNVAGENFLFNVYVDGVPQTAVDTATVRNAVLSNDANLDMADYDIGIPCSGTGTLFEVFVDDQSYWDDGYSNKVTAISLVTTHTWLAEVTADMNNNGLGLNTYMTDTNDNGGVAMKANKAIVPEDMTSFKEGDRVLVQMTYPDVAAQRVVRHVLPAELSEDTYVSGYKSAAGRMTSLRVDEVDKDLADEIHTNSDILSLYTLQTLRNYTYDVWADQYGNVIGIEFNKTDVNYVFVTGFEFTSSYLTATTCKANVIWPDGVMESINVALAANGSARPYLQAVAANDTKGNGTGSATVNTWFTYSKSDAGQVVLSNAVGYLSGGANTTGNVKQAAIALNDAAGNVEISSTTPTLQYKAGGVAFGNDKTIYITAAAANAAQTGIIGGAIAKVTGVNTGIKNVRIDTTDIAAMAGDVSGFGITKQDLGYVANTTGIQNVPAAFANTYFIYNENTGYVIAAVVVSESKGGDVIYIINQARRDYVAGVGYVDTYNAIVNGEKTTIQVDCTSTNTNDTKLTAGRLYVMRKSGDYYVGYENTNTNVLNTNNNAKFGYVAATGLNGNTRKVTLKENTLWINDTKDNQNYILTNGQTVYFVNQNAGTTWSKFTTAGAALAAGNVAGKTFISAVYGDCDGGTGVAKTVIFVVSKVGAGGGTGTTGGTGATTYTTNIAWDTSTGSEAVVRFEGVAPTAGQVKSYVAQLTDKAVKKVTLSTANNGFGGSTFEVEMADGTIYYVDTEKVYTVRVDGVIQATYDASEATFGATDTITVAKSQTYIGSTVGTSTGAGTNFNDITAYLAGTLTTDKLTSDASGKMTIDAAGGVLKDLAIVTAYTVTDGTYTGFTGGGFDVKNDNQAWTAGVSGNLYPVGSKVSLKETGGTALNAYVSMYNKADENAVLVEGKYSDNATGVGPATAGKEEISFTLTKDVTLDATVTYLVKIDGVEYGYHPVTTTADGYVAFTAPVTGATYAKVGAVDDGGKASALVTSVAYTGATTYASYKVAAADADASGVIELVQVVEADALTGVGATYDLNGTDTAVSAGDYFVVGTTLTVTSTANTTGYWITVKEAGGTAAKVEGSTTADGTNYAVAEYTLADTDVALTFATANS